MASNKKILIVGCFSIITLLGILLIGGVGYTGYKGYRYKQVVQKSQKEMSDMYQALDDEFVFTAPADGIMQPSQVQNFLKVRSSLAIFSKEPFDNVKNMRSRIQSRLQFSGFFSIIKIYRNLKNFFVDATQADFLVGKEHCRLLREIRMSPKEYEWITRTYLGTLAGSQLASFPDLQTEWETYKTRFEEERVKWKDYRTQLDNKTIRGDDINMANLMKKLQPVVFQPANAQLVKDTYPQFVINDDSVIVDYLAMYAVPYIEFINYYDRLMRKTVEDAVAKAKESKK